MRKTLIGRLAGFCYDRRRLVLAAWIGLIVVINVIAFALPGKFRDDFGGGNSESQRALRFLRANFPAQAGDPAQAVFVTSTPITSPQNQAKVEQVLAAMRGMKHIVSVNDPYSSFGQISANGRVAFATMQFDVSSDHLTKSQVKPILDKARSFATSGFDVELGGAPIEKAETPVLGSAEGIGIFAAIIILLFAFGSVIAMGLPIGTALCGIAVGVAVIDLFSHLTVVPTFGTELAAMIGIGVGIDYALFLVTRYRQGLDEENLDPRDSVIAALSTSGRAVLFAGCTVVISLLGMLLLGLPFVYGLAVGAIAAVLLVMLGALTLLPALLGFTGHAIDKLKVPRLHRKTTAGEHRQSFWWRWSRLIQRVPWLAALISLAILVVLALPLFSMKLAFTDAGNDQANLSTRKAYDLLAQNFGPGANAPLVISVDLRHQTDHGPISTLLTTLPQTPGIKAVTPATLSPNGQSAVIVVIPTTSPQDNKTQQLVHRLRKQVVPAAVQGTGTTVLVGGVTAASVDSSSQLSHRLPIVIGGVIILAFLLLMSVFRSIAVPLKAAIMNLLSIGAAYGVIVAVFQWGWLGNFFNIGATGPIDPWVPLMLFTILFGLSMDYEVFLLSRIREEWIETKDNGTAVADGLAITARVITAAAAIMVCVFGSFVLGDIRVLKLFGLGLASAVLVDATVVRMVLVPATMELLGGANWWLPRWLDSIVPRLNVEGAPPPEPVAVAGGDSA